MALKLPSHLRSTPSSNRKKIKANVQTALSVRLLRVVEEASEDRVYFFPVLSVTFSGKEPTGWRRWAPGAH